MDSVIRLLKNGGGQQPHSTGGNPEIDQNPGGEGERNIPRCLMLHKPGLAPA